MATKKLELHDTIKTWMEKINDNLTVIDGIEVADFEQLVNAANTIEEKLVEVDESVSLSKDWANKTGSTVDGVEFSAKKYALDAKDSEETSVLSAIVAGTKAVEVNTSVLEASTFADQAYNSKNAAKTSEDKAKTSELAAKQSETNAASSASTALGYRNAAEQAATVATGARNEAIEAKDDAVAEANDIRTNWQDKLDAAAQYASDVEDIKTEIRNWYYGQLEADPVTRPDGTPVQVGDEYHDSVNHVRKVYSNGGWEAVSVAGISMPGGAALVGQGVMAVNTIADLLTLPAGQRKADMRYLVKEYHAGTGVGGGEFYWDVESVEVDNQGTVFAVTGVTTGRFILQRGSTVTPMNFGAYHLSTTDSINPINKFIQFLSIDNKNYLYSFSGDYRVSSTVDFIGVSGKVISVDATIRATQPLEIVLKFTNCGDSKFPGYMRVVGTGATSLASNTCIDGIVFDGCRASEFGKFRVEGGIGWGAREGSGNNNMMSIDQVESLNFGSSARSTRDHRITINGFTRTGSNNAPNQRSILTVNDLTSLPPIPNGYLVIGGDLYIYESIDYITGELSVFPWVKSEYEVPGTEIKTIFGGGVKMGSNSGAKIKLGMITPTRCGIGLLLDGASAPNVDRLVSQFNGVGLGLGGLTGSRVFSGSDLSSVYFEAEAVAEIVNNSATGSFSHGSSIRCVTSMSLSKVFSIQPSGASVNPYFPVDLFAVGNKHLPLENAPSIATNVSTDRGTFNLTHSDQRLPKLIQIYRSTVTLNLVDDLDFRRLKGPSVLTAIVTGGGGNYNYAGGLYVKADAGYTINGISETIRIAVNTNPYRLTAWMTSETNWALMIEELSKPVLFE